MIPGGSAVRPAPAARPGRRPSRGKVSAHMASKKPRRRRSRKPARTAARPRRAKRPAAAPKPAPVRGAERREIGHVTLEVARAGAARVKRMIYPPGFRWSTDMKPVVGTEWCMHAHVGFLVSGEIHIEYADGCVVEFKAPQVVAIDPGHDGWVVGRQPAVLVEIDFLGDTARRLGMPDQHRH